jgi:hypothetical protein
LLPLTLLISLSFQHAAFPDRNGGPLNAPAGCAP